VTAVQTVKAVGINLEFDAGRHVHMVCEELAPSLHVFVVGLVRIRPSGNC